MTDPPEVPVATDAVVCGPVWISPVEMCEVRVHGRPVPMSLTRLRLLVRLIQAEGRIVSRDELYGLAKANQMPPDSRAVDVHVALIRRALGRFGQYLIGVPGRGYRLDVLSLSQEP